MAHNVPVDDLSKPAIVPDVANVFRNLTQLAATSSPFSNSPPTYKRCTLTKIPQTAALLEKSKLPFGLLITPYRQLLMGDV
jgi:hypothetical protein